MLKNKLIAIIPKYIPDLGNCTIIHTEEENPLILENTISTVMKRIGRYHMVDLEAMKERNGNLINISYPVPIYLHDDVFIPIKVRKPFGKNDKSFGYVNLEYIDNIKQENNHTIILLRNQVEIYCLFRKETLSKHIGNGTIIKKFYKDRITSNLIRVNINVDGGDTTSIYEKERTIINLFVGKVN